MSEREESLPDEWGDQPQRRGERVWNFLSILLLAVIGFVALWFGLIYMNPQAAFNPYPPPTMPAQIVLPTATQTPMSLPPTWTPTATQTLFPTSTPDLNAGLPTPIDGGILTVPTATPASSARYTFALQSEPAAIDASVLYPDRSCNWMGVGGQVLDLQGSGITGITVQVGGRLDNKTVTLYPSLTGTALKYGPAGYEVTLAEKPLASDRTVWIQLLDQQKMPLSERVYFSTSADCDKNLIIINFKQVR